MWVRFKTQEPIKKPLGNVRFEWEHPKGLTTLWPLNLIPLEGWQGFNAVILGTIGRARPEEHAGPYWFISMGTYGDVNVRLWCARLWETGSPLQTEAAWSDAQGHHAYIRVGAGSWSDKQLKRAGEGIQLLRGLRLTLLGRRRLEDKPEWRALMREIEAYRIKNPTAKLERIVKHFGLADLSYEDDLDTILDEEAAGIDPWERKTRSATAKLKAWLGKWRKLSKEEQIS